MVYFLLIPILLRHLYLFALVLVLSVEMSISHPELISLLLHC